jgi:plastocyanin
MEPSEAPKDLMETLLDVAAIFITPDWNALLALIPMLLALLFVAWFAFTFRKFATLGPRRRAPARIEPVTPAHVHMPGGSAAPILVAIGAGALFLGLAFGGLALWVGVALLVVTLLIWFREAMRDYDRIEATQRLPAVVHPGPPPGVHMPGPSIRPLMGALGTAALLGGLVIGGWVLVLAVAFLVWTLIGWLVDFTAEYRKLEEADRTGHLENIPPRPLPARTLQVFAVLFVLVAMVQLGIFPPAAPSTAGGPGTSPGASGPPAGESGAPGDLVLIARDISFDRTTLQAPAGQPFTITFRNEDAQTVTHDVDIRSADGATVIADQQPIPGGREQAYQYEALEAGDYQFLCSVHPIAPMTGTLTVQ